MYIQAWESKSAAIRVTVWTGGLAIATWSHLWQTQTAKLAIRAGQKCSNVFPPEKNPEIFLIESMTWCNHSDCSLLKKCCSLSVFSSWRCRQHGDQLHHCFWPDNWVNLTTQLAQACLWHTGACLTNSLLLFVELKALCPATRPKGRRLIQTTFPRLKGLSKDEFALSFCALCSLNNIDNYLTISLCWFWPVLHISNKYRSMAAINMLMSA